MSLYTQWTDMVVDYVKTKGENAFWAEYSKLEENIYLEMQRWALERCMKKI